MGIELEATSPIFQCEEPKEPTIGDHTELLTSLASPEHLESPNTVNTPISSLEILDIKRLCRGDPENTSNFSKPYGSILERHSNLRASHVEGAAINQLLVSSDQRQESRTSEQVCTRLEYLALALSPLEWNIIRKGEKYRCWDEVFIPIEKLSLLKTISIKSNDLEAYPGRGLFEKCPPLYDLKPLVPSAPDNGLAWRVDQARSLLEEYLKLRSINPCCLVGERGSTIRVWLDNECDRRTDFISFYSEGDDGEYQEPDCGEYEDDSYGYGNHQDNWY